MKKKILFIMGVSGSGKSTVAESISSLLSYSYIDADDYHPEANIAKMKHNIPLNDVDRQPWLDALNTMATVCIDSNENLVIACSCLKPEYRKILQAGIQESCLFVYLKGSFEVISERMKKRGEHYFNGDSMLRSQFDTLIEPSTNEPIDYIEVSILENDINAVVELTVKNLRELNYV
ncbi:gluconokinase [Agarivorans sp. QJM3NY_33]|uniref:gluconokinase n=1 Tax=Agarivorans sp. QJM3NY_33 TaxID=3421432 RepID=UPI003D7D6E85